MTQTDKQRRTDREIERQRLTVRHGQTNIKRQTDRGIHTYMDRQRQTKGQTIKYKKYLSIQAHEVCTGAAVPRQTRSIQKDKWWIKRLAVRFIGE